MNEKAMTYFERGRSRLACWAGSGLVWLFTLAMLVGMYAPGLAQSPEVRVGLVTDEFGVSGNPFNQMAHEGFLLAQTDFGISGTIYQAVDADDYGNVLSECAQNNDLCLTVGFMMADAMQAAAGAYPSTAFAGIDIFFDMPPENLRGVLFRVREVGYLAGVLGGLMSDSNIVGGIGGMDIQPVRSFLEGYQNGAQCQDPELEVRIEYVGTFVDPDLGATTAMGMIGTLGEGADVIFAPAGLTGEGAVLAATQAGVWGIGVDTDWYVTVFGEGTVAGSDKLLTSAMKRLDKAVYMTIEDYINGAFSGGIQVYGLEAGGVELAPFHETDAAVTQSVRDVLAATESGLIDGSIDIYDTCREEPPPEPSFAVVMSHNEVHAYDWPEGAMVTLEIDDPSNGVGVDYTDVQPSIVTSWDPNQTWSLFQLGDAFSLMPDHIVTVSDGVTPKSHTVTHLMLAGVDPDTDDVYGTAEAGSGVDVWIDQDPNAWVFVTADESTGEWLADFSGIFNIDLGTELHVYQGDEDGDGTRFDYYIPNPFFEANLSSNWIAANEFPAYSEITANIYADDTPGDLLFTVPQTANEWGHAWFDLWELGFESLQPGQYVQVTGEGLVKDLVLLLLTVDVFDLGTGEISGTAPDGETVRVDACNEIIPDVEYDCRSEEVIVVGGTWSVTFTEFLNPGTWSAAFITDEDGDSTMAEPMQPEPPPEGGMDTWSVALGDLDNDDDLDAFVGNTGYNQVWLNDGGAYFGDSGQRLGDADTWAVALADLDGDGDLDAFVGNTGEQRPGAENTIWMNQGDGYFIDSGQRLGDSVSEAVALGDLDGDGDVDGFVANAGDFGAANTVWRNDGVGGFELIQSLGVSASFGVALGDLDGDGDLDAFVANMGDNKVWFNDGTGQFADSGQAFGPAEGRDVVLGDFDTDGDLDAFVVSHFSQGMNVWLNDNGTGFFTDVRSLLNADTVSLDMADLNGDTYIDAFVGNFDITNQIYLNDGSANFTDSGAYLDDGDHSEAVALGDLDGDSDVDAFVGNSFGQPNKVWLNDGEGVFTDSGQRLNGGEEGPLPRFEAYPEDDTVQGFDWQEGSAVDLTIEDPVEGEIFNDTQIASPAEWDPNTIMVMFELPEAIDLRGGHILTMSSEGIIKVHEVTDLAVTAVDPVLDTVSGTAAPGSLVDVWHCDEFGCVDRHETATSSGDWTADFSVPGDEGDEQNTLDLVPGMSITAAQWDEDDDGTLVHFYIPNPRIEAGRQFEFVGAFEWPMNAMVELTIDDDGDPSNGVVYTDSALATPAPWDPSTTFVGFSLPEGIDLKVGHDITVSDSSTIKVHIVNAVQIVGYDPEAGTIFGTADPGSGVRVIPLDHWEDEAYTEADATGNWAVSFLNVVELVPGAGFQAIQEDDDGDSSWFNWWVPIVIEIDIWPYLQRNIVLLGRNHRIPVAIFSTDEFDAPTTIDQNLLTFGRTGNEESLIRCTDRSLDFNHDGLPDLLCLFSNELAGFESGDEEGVLRAMAYDVGAVEGRDTVMVIEPLSSRYFTARLSGSNVVPPVETDAYGFASLRLSWRETRLSYVIFLRHAEDIVEVTIQCAPEGDNGPVGATLYSGAPVDRSFFWGRITSPDDGDENACGWTDLSSMVAAMRSGDTYLSVQTTEHPSGDIRGQIELASY